MKSKSHPHISVSGKTYDKIKRITERREIRISDFIDNLINDYLDSTKR